MAARTSKPAPETSGEEPQEQPDPALGQGVAEVHATVNEAVERGLQGSEVDPTPNEHYTMAGVIAGLPVPETDDDAAHEARQAGGGFR